MGGPFERTAADLVADDGLPQRGAGHAPGVIQHAWKSGGHGRHRLHLAGYGEGGGERGRDGGVNEWT